jgi:hypothetical protein
LKPCFTESVSRHKIEDGKFCAYCEVDLSDREKLLQKFSGKIQLSRSCQREMRKGFQTQFSLYSSCKRSVEILDPRAQSRCVLGLLGDFAQSLPDFFVPATGNVSCLFAFERWSRYELFN